MATVPPHDHVAEEICKVLKGTLGPELGQGAAKHTFRAEIAGYGPVALKILDPAFPADRLAREVAAMQRCKDPAIGQLLKFDRISVGGTAFPYFLEEFHSGGSLQEWVDQHGPLTPSQARDIARRLAAAIVHLRGQNLVHRDIKPANILLRSGLDTPVLTDFGIVRDLNASALTHSHLMHGPGTPLYASPEQLRNEKHMIDWRTDQFCLGVTIAMCTLGSHPYAQGGDSGAAWISRVMHRQTPRPTFATECVAASLSGLPRMVAAWPVHRFQDGDQLVQAWS